MADQKNRVKILENKSEIGAGTRGASLGVDSLKVASLNSKSSYFFRHESIVLEDFNSLLFEEVKYPRAKRIGEMFPAKGWGNCWENCGSLPAPNEMN